MPALFNTDSVKDANYIKHIDGNSIGNWVVYNDGGATPQNPVDGTGGSPTLTFVSSTNTAIRGSNNFLLTKSASNQQGQGFSYLCSIDPSDRGKVLRFNFEYLVASGTYADGNLTVWFYDVTNGQLIQGAPTSIQNSQLIERFQSEVQIPITCAEMRVIIHVATATATAYTMRFDNFSFGPSEKLYSGQITDWVSYIPTLTNDTGSTTNYNRFGKWRKVGDSLEGQIALTFTGAAGTWNGMSFSLPTGLSIDTTKFPVDTALTEIQVGNGTFTDFGVQQYDGFAVYNDSTSIRVLLYQTNTNYATPAAPTQAIPFSWAANDRIQFSFKVPIVGWSSSSQVVSDNYSGRVVAASINAGVQSWPYNTQQIVSYVGVTVDTTNSFNTNTKKYKVPVAGVYSISAWLSLNYPSAVSCPGSIMIYKNNVQITSSAVPDMVYTQKNGNFGTYAPVYRIGCELSLNAGEEIWIEAIALASASTGNVAINNYTGVLDIQRVSGPSQVLAGESVNLRAVSATTTITASGSIVVFSSKEYDSHGIYSTATGAITIPSPGKYSFKVSTEAVSGASASVANVGTYMTLFKGIPGSGVSNTMFDNLRWPVVTTSLMPVILKGSTTVTANAGDVFYIVQQRDSTVSSYSLSGGAQTNVLVVEKVGN